MLVLATVAGSARAQLLTVSGNPGSLNIVAASPGTQPNSVADASTSYTVTTVLRSKIAVAIDAAMPSGLTLIVTLAAPAGATSSGPITLSTAAQDAVRGIPLGTVLSTHSITYDFTATVSAGIVPATTRTVTLTILPDP